MYTVSDKYSNICVYTSNHQKNITPPRRGPVILTEVNIIEAAIHKMS